IQLLKKRTLIAVARVIPRRILKRKSHASSGLVAKSRRSIRNAVGNVGVQGDANSLRRWCGGRFIFITLLHSNNRTARL
ncbi:MAG: hypothetical protein R6U20_13135, partial [Longimonas sp.]|uniref:hypothetical protein n=1 Tax=Longimonas sp. TaxID=2039626 RepID=UPI0039769799